MQKMNLRRYRRRIKAAKKFAAEAAEWAQMASTSSDLDGLSRCAKKAGLWYRFAHETMPETKP